MRNLINIWNETNKKLKGVYVFNENCEFEIKSIKTSFKSPNIHILDNTFKIFGKISIIIYYENIDFLKAVEHAKIIFLDPNFDSKFIQISKKKLIFSKNLNDSDIYRFLIENSIDTKKIFIEAMNEKSIKYAESVLIYKEIKNYDKDYFLNEELLRWKNFTPNK